MARTKINGMDILTYKRKILKEDYPHNLILAAISFWQLEAPAEYTPEVLAGIESAIGTLSNREQNLLHLRYKEGKTLKEIISLTALGKGIS